MGEREQKLFPTEMILVGSTPAAPQTAIEQSRTPKPKFSFLQRQAKSEVEHPKLAALPNMLLIHVCWVLVSEWP